MGSSKEEKSTQSMTENRIAKKLSNNMSPKATGKTKTVFAIFVEIWSSAGGWLISAWVLGCMDYH